MKTKKQKKISSSLFNMIFVLVTVSGLSAIILGLANKYTIRPIQDAKDNRELKAITEVLPGEFDNNPFLDRFTIKSEEGDDNLELYIARKDNKVSSVAIKTYTNKAFGGRIEMIVGFFLDGSINKFKITEHKETPGLGTKVMDEKFSKQLEEFNPRYHIMKVKQDGGEVDAVTAATISSRAVLDAIQRAYDRFSILKYNTGNQQ